MTGDSSTVADLDLSIDWKRCREGQSWNGTKCLGEPTLFTSDDALEQYHYPPSAGWRIPTENEFAQMSTCESDWCKSLWPDVGGGEFLVYYDDVSNHICIMKAGSGTAGCTPSGIDAPTLSILLVRDTY